MGIRGANYIPLVAIVGAWGKEKSDRGVCGTWSLLVVSEKNVVADTCLFLVGRAGPVCCIKGERFGTSLSYRHQRVAKRCTGGEFFFTFLSL